MDESKEIPGNGIDDDKNGYIDDIHGWNFLGDAVHEQLEMTRIVKKGPGTPEYDTKQKAELEEELKCSTSKTTIRFYCKC